jgi:demethylmenaquinone methyltransferase / 2-methoxy-6-polyprenyl-1,4-benzoquinol methylase
LSDQNVINKKTENVAAMFNDIAASYDFLNHFLSANIDKVWRKKAVKMLLPYSPKTILDVATGTGDLAITLQKLNPDKTIGIDIADDMLAIGQKKIDSLGLQNKIEFRNGNALNIPYPKASFDAVTVAFGIRNFEDINKGISQIYDILTSDGVFLILEFSRPKKNFFGYLFQFYFKRILPVAGWLFSKNKKAYKYLFDTVQQFPSVDEVKDKLKTHGFRDVKTKTLSMGIATIYIALK